MRPSVALHQHRDEIRRIALSHRVTNVRVFGSALHGDDTEDSDLDLLVEPTSETTHGHRRDSLRTQKIAGHIGRCPYAKSTAR